MRSSFIGLNPKLIGGYMTEETAPRRRCRPRKSRHRKIARKPPGSQPTSTTVFLPPAIGTALTAAGKARGISARAVVVRLLAILGREPGLIDAILDDV